VLTVCFGLLVGLSLARLSFSAPLLPTVIIFVFGLIISRRSRLASTILLVLAAMSFGVWRGEQYLMKLRPYDQLSMQKVTLEATAHTDAIYSNRGQLSFKVRGIKIVDPAKQTVPGEIKINGFGELAIYKGDILRLEGKLYPTKGSSQAAMYYAKITRIGSNTNLFNEIVRRFTAGMQTALPEPVASFGLGLLVGQRNTLPDEVNQSLKEVGLVHIVAVSGYNLTILIQFARRRLEHVSKRLTVITAAALIIGFLLCTGMSASIVRASVVSAIGLAAWFCGRHIRPLVLIALSAALTAVVNPIYIWSDIGWYLSFLAFFGILVLAPMIFAVIYGQKQPNIFIAVAIETVCAELFTLPLILYIFGQMSLVGVIANVIVVTLIPLAMALCFVAGLSGVTLGSLAGVVALPARILLTYMLDIANLLSRLPHSFISGQYISAWRYADSLWAFAGCNTRWQ